MKDNFILNMQLAEVMKKYPSVKHYDIIETKNNIRQTSANSWSGTTTLKLRILLKEHEYVMDVIENDKKIEDVLKSILPPAYRLSLNKHFI